MIYLNDKPVHMDRYPNGETMIPLVAIEDDPVLRLHWETDGDLIRLMFVKDMVERRRAGSWAAWPALEIEYMPYSRMDRANEQFAFTLASIGTFLNHLNFRYVQIWEPHSEETLLRVQRSNAVYPTIHMLPRVMDETGWHPATDVLVVPDEGAYKRYSSLAIGVKYVVMNKKRDFVTGQVQGMWIASGEEHLAKARRAIIVDDLCSYGGTFERCSNILRDKGVEQVFLVVAHLERSVYKGSLLHHIDHIYATESMQTREEAGQARSEHVTLYKREEWKAAHDFAR